MGKYISLLSVFALAGCMGGGSNGTGDIRIPSTYVDTVGQSNAQVTSMVSNSEYQVARYVANKLGEDAGSVNLTRGSSIRGAFTPSETGSENLDYNTAHELVELAAWLANSETEYDDIVETFNRSNEDKNKIKAALKLMDDMYCFVGGNAGKTAQRIIDRRSTFVLPLADLQQKTRVFDLSDVTFTMSEITDTADYDLINIETDSQTGEINGITMTHKGIQGNVIHRVGDKVFADSDETIDVDMLGTLRYSDFGYVHTIDVETGTQWDTALSGGYEHYRIDKDDIHNAITFSGRAVGGVNRELHGYDDDTGEMIANQKLDTGPNGATLTFDDGAEDLIMNFPDWYTVRVHKDSDKNTADIEFDATGKTINPDLQVEQNQYTDFNQQTYGIGTNGMIGRYDVAYYGLDGNVSETTGIVSIRETTGIIGNPGDSNYNVDDVNELSFNSAFGMTK